MARDERDREDLLGEATALVRRMGFSLPNLRDTFVVGFRRHGDASLYVGTDLVFQFNTAGELRRGFLDGHLVKAEAGRLVRLQRRRTESEVQLVRHELSDHETSWFLEMASRHLQEIRGALTSQQAQIVGQVPEGEDVAGDVLRWLESLPSTLTVATRPHANG